MSKGKTKKPTQKPQGNLETPESYMEHLKAATREAGEKRTAEFAKRFAATAPAPKFKTSETEDGTHITELDAPVEALMVACGTVNPTFAHIIASQVAKATFDKREPVYSINAGLAAMAGIAPHDETEALLAAQMTATHTAAMRMLDRTMRETGLEQAQWQGSFAIKLLRTFAQQADTLKRLRSKGDQTVRVEHVTVNAGGQAIVGNVTSTGGGGVATKAEDQPHAIDYQPAETMPPLSCQDPPRESVPISSRVR